MTLKFTLKPQLCYQAHNKVTFSINKNWSYPKDRHRYHIWTLKHEAQQQPTTEKQMKILTIRFFVGHVR